MISMIFSVYKSTASLFSISIFGSASKQPVFCPLSRKQASGSKVNIATVPFTVHFSLFKHGSTIHGYYSRFLFCLFKEARSSVVSTLHFTLHFTFPFSFNIPRELSAFPPLLFFFSNFGLAWIVQWDYIIITDESAAFPSLGRTSFSY